MMDNWVNGQLKLKKNEWFDYVSGKIVKKKENMEVELIAIKPNNIKEKPVVFEIEPKPVELIKMNISTGNELMSLLNDEEKKKNVNELVIEEGCGNELKEDLKICRLENLKKLIVKKDSLKNLNSLVISNISELKSIEIKDGEPYDKENQTHYSPFEKVKNVEISSIF